MLDEYARFGCTEGNPRLYSFPIVNSIMALADVTGDYCTAEKLYPKLEEIHAAWDDHKTECGMYRQGCGYDGEIQTVREQIGYIPWIYGIPTEGKDDCFRNLLDPDCFLAKYGLRTADASHPGYRKPFDHEYLWNGPVWPFAAAKTLTAVIEYLHTADNIVLEILL